MLKQAQVEPITQHRLHITRQFLRGKPLTLDQVADHLLAGTLLHACALQGSLPMVQMLLNAGADPNAVDPVRFRPAFPLATRHLLELDRLKEQLLSRS